MNPKTTRALGASLLGTCLILAAGSVLAQNQPAKTGDVEFAGLRGTVPKVWNEDRILKKESYKRYQLDAIGDIKYYAHVNLCRVDKDKGGFAADAQKHWQAMFVPPQGTTTPPVSKVQKFKVGNLQFTSVDITGTFKGFADDPDSAYIDFRLIGVYVQTPDGTWYATLIGPSATVEFYRTGFEDWLKGLH
jgi:ketosteroid isomerase-like protein